MKLAIKVLTEWDRENVIPFFEKHFPNCNYAWETKEVKIGDIFYISKNKKLYKDDKIYHIVPSYYTIIQGVPKDMKLPKVEENRVGYWQTTKTREQELEECLRYFYTFGSLDSLSASDDSKMREKSKQLLNK